MTEVLSYCRLFSYDFMKCQEFVIYVERMDNVYMDFVAEKQEEERAKTANRSGR